MRKKITVSSKKSHQEASTVLLKNLPTGFEESMSYGMIGYVVPLSVYPDGYHTDPSQPLPFINIASQKNHLTIYHMGLYANEKLMEWFKTEYSKHSKTGLDMGKSFIRFKNPDKMPYDLIADLVSMMTALEWINLYEKSTKR